MLLKGKCRVSLFGLALYLLLMTVLSSLGVWQLRRANEKREFLEAMLRGMQSAEMLDLKPTSQIDSQMDRYKRIRVAGFYDSNHQFLIDNQVRNGKVGYMVLTPFIFNEQPKLAVLVNRGWIDGGRQRSILPNIAISNTVSSVVGRINQPVRPGIKLSGAEIPSEGWPAIVQWPDIAVISQKLGYALRDLVIELDDDQIEGYQRQWQNQAVITPEKHLAYALQWFSLAATLTALSLWFCFRKTQ